MSSKQEETSCKIGKKGCFFAPPIPYSLSLLRQAIFTQKKGKILWGKYLMQRGFDISLNVFVCHVQVGRYSLFIHNL